MTEHKNFDDDDGLSALWRSHAPAFDAAAVIREVERQSRFQRDFLRGCYAASGIVLIVIAWFDLEGLFIVPGAMTALVAGSILWQVWRQRIAARRCPTAAAMGPRALLAHALRHAKASLRAARVAYTVVPTSVMLGVAMGPLLMSDDGDLSGPKWTGLAVAALLAGMVAAGAVWGVLTASVKKAEVGALEARIKKFDASV